jgi:hypothetical protein
MIIYINSLKIKSTVLVLCVMKKLGIKVEEDAKIIAVQLTTRNPISINRRPWMKKCMNIMALKSTEDRLPIKKFDFYKKI